LILGTSSTSLEALSQGGLYDPHLWDLSFWFERED
jgi:hypothetical protein